MKRRWIFWLLVVVFLIFVFTRLTEIENLAQTLASGQWEWVLIAAALQVVYYLVVTAAYQAAFWTVEVKSRVAELMPVTFASIFINVAAPSANVSGMALWADDAARRGQSPARAAAGVLLHMIGELATFSVVCFLGMAYLFLQNNLQSYQVIGALMLLVMTGTVTGILGIGLWQPDRINKILSWMQRTSDSFAARWRRQPFLMRGWAETNAAEFIDASNAIARYPTRLLRMLGLIFIGHIVDLASLFALFLAFHNPVSLGVLVAGYAMGILFWIVSPIPQGIGVVEGVMPIVFASLSVPSAVATTVSLAFRGLTFWLPLSIGFVILRRVRTFGAEERSISESWFVRLIAILTALMGAVNVLSALAPSMRDRIALLQVYSPLGVRHGGRLTAVLAGFALIVLAQGLWRRKRVAWIGTLVVLLVSAASHLIKGIDYEETLMALGLTIWLVALRDHFHARSDRPSVQQGLRALAAAFFFTLGYGVLGFYLLDRHYTVNFDFLNALRQTVVMFTQFYDPGLEPITGFGRYFAVSIYIVAFVTFGYAFWMLLRPVLVRDPATPEQRQRAAQIVEQFGRSAMARLTLLEDKAVFFSPGGSYIAYTVKGRTAVALGDPIGPSDDLAGSIASFRNICIQNDWTPVFYQTLPDTLASYTAQGFRSICIGQDAIVDVHSYSLEGVENKSTRNAFHHIQKIGCTFQVYPAPVSDAVMRELSEISDEWLTMMHGSEKRFSLGWFDPDYLRSTPLAVVLAPKGWITAFVNILPEYQRNEVAIDLMRRRREVESGTMDFLFVSLIEWARQQGYDSFNLGLSSLSGVGEHPEDPALERVMHYTFEHINQFYNFKGLHEFKQKFHPVWSPRYLIYPDAVDLPSVWMSVVQANSGTNEFPLELLRRKRKSPSREGVS